MSDELTMLMHRGTWELLSPPNNCKPVGCKWVFRVKRNHHGSIDCFKVRLVAKGHNQREGLDYNKTFSPVVKPATIRTVLIVIVIQGRLLTQLDVNNAFLRGELTETVYMVQLLGFKDASEPNHVCRLLKQAPRAWYSALKLAIVDLVFQNPKANSSLFIYNHNSVITIY